MSDAVLVVCDVCRQVDFVAPDRVLAWHHDHAHTEEELA